MDAWFLGFTSKLVIGVYVGFDEPKTLGKYETGAKAALPVFKKFVSKVVKKKDALPFKVPKNISLVIIDLETGLYPNSNTKQVIYESFKTSKILIGIDKLSDKNKLGFFDSKNKKKILRFY
jgi:penicillin-binding protein 1A